MFISSNSSTHVSSILLVCSEEITTSFPDQRELEPPHCTHPGAKTRQLCDAQTAKITVQFHWSRHVQPGQLCVGHLLWLRTTFPRKNSETPKLVVDFLWEEDISSPKKIVEDFVEESFHNNDKPWKSSRTSRHFSFFIFFIFLHFPKKPFHSFSFFHFCATSGPSSHLFICEHSCWDVVIV